MQFILIKAIGQYQLKHSFKWKLKCEDHSHVKTLQPPITIINLHPACSALSSDIKLPPYFKQYSKGSHIELKFPNFHMSKFSPTKFRIWTHFNLSDVTQPEVKNLRKLAPIPAIYIDSVRSRPWIYYVGGGSGSGLILLIAICCLLYWCCKKTLNPETRWPTCVAYTDPENPNMMHTRMGAISTDKYSVLGHSKV